jgi:hypothetical protein
MHGHMTVTPHTCVWLLNFVWNQLLQEILE